MSIKARFNVRFSGFHLAAELTISETGVTTLFGPSGSGKTTLLRCLAGLERSPDGYLSVGGDIWQDEAKKLFVPVHRRPIGYVFQEPRLFHHLTVQDNLDFAYKRLPVIERKVDREQIISLLNLAHLLNRKPYHLSGGEQQRVAIGRALLASPRLLFMDEPLAALDLPRKQEVIPFIRKLHDELVMPIVYVSHALQEVLQITDNMVLMDRGKCVASGTIVDICSKLEMSDYLGDMTGAVIDTRVIAHDLPFGLTTLGFSGGKLQVPYQRQDVHSRLRVHILARNVGIALERPPTTTSYLNILAAEIIEISSLNMDSHEVQIKLDVGVPLVAYISRKSLSLLKLQKGNKCYALIKAVSLTKNETG